MWNLTYDTNEFIYETETDLTDIENKLMVTKVEREGRRGQIRGVGLRDTNYYT